MDSINLQGYFCFLENQGFYKKSEENATMNSKNIITDALLISKFRTPTKSDVLSAFQGYVRNILSKKKEELSLFEHVLATTGIEDLEKYSQEGSPDLDILRNYISVSHLLEGREYMQVNSATIAYNRLHSAEKIEGEDDFDRYLRTLSDEGEDHQSIQVILYKGALPTRKSLDTMLNMRIRDSSAFWVSNSYEEYYKAKETVLAVHSGIVPSGMNLLVDKSKRMLDETILQMRLEMLSSDAARKKRSILEQLLRQNPESTYEFLGMDTKKMN